jgi:hypothetical protein
MNQARRDECRNFVKQLGANAWVDRGRWHNDHTIRAVDIKDGPNVRLLLNDKKGGEPWEWPEEFRVRETPRGLTPRTTESSVEQGSGDGLTEEELGEGDSLVDFLPDDSAQEAL